MRQAQRQPGAVDRRGAGAPTRLTVVVLTALALVGCRSAAQPPALELAVPGEFSASGETVLDERWWRAFEDPRLDHLVTRSLHGNFDLAATWQRLLEARAAWELVAAERWPTLDAEGEATVRRGDEGESERFALGLAASYEIDLWGRIAARAAAEHHRAAASRADYRAAAISLSAEVAEAWFRLREARAQRALLLEQVATNEAVLELLRSRFGGGQVRHVDILRQRQLLAATRGELAANAATRELLAHRLALLQGRAPGALGDDVPPPAAQPRLPALPPLPATGLPGALVERRPDVLRARLLLAAANRELAAAISDRYPRIALTGAVTTAAERPGDLFRNWIYTLAGNLLAPLFDGGARAAEVRRQEAVERRHLLAYAEAVITAFGEVEDALSRERWQRQRIESLAAQLELAHDALEELRTAYRNGVVDYLDVLIALRGNQGLQRELLAARGELVIHRIGLYRALAGGFDTPREIDPGTSVPAGDTAPEEEP